LAESVLNILEEIWGNVADADELVAGSVDDHCESVIRFGEQWAANLAEHGRALAALINYLHDFPDLAGLLITTFTDQVNALADSFSEAVERDDYTGHDQKAATFAAIGAFGVAALAGGDTTEYIAKVAHMLFFGLTIRACPHPVQAHC
jgi:hypothetical protein